MPGVRQISSLADLNAQVRVWMAETANCRIHGTTHEKPIVRFPQENLRPLTGVAEFDTATYLDRKVARDCYVDVETNRYSVPWAYAGRDVRIRIDERGRLQVLWGGAVIARRRVSNGRFQVITNPKHFEGLPLGDGQTSRIRRVLVAVPSVEVRSLAAYEAAAEAGGDD